MYFLRVSNQFSISYKTDGNINYSAVDITLMLLCLKAGMVEPEEKTVAKNAVFLSIQIQFLRFSF
jgi:hypothetical protein